MTHPEFDKEMQRLVRTFPRSGLESIERIEMVWRTVCDLSHSAFARIVDQFISTLRQAPLPRDFTEAAQWARRNEFKADVSTASGWLNKPLPEVLAQEYPGCRTAKEAVQVQILRNHIKNAK